MERATRYTRASPCRTGTSTYSKGEAGTNNAAGYVLGSNQGGTQSAEGQQQPDQRKSAAATLGATTKDDRSTVPIDKT